MKMNALYRVTGTSKQAFHQYLDREMLVMEEQQQLLPVLSQIRADHPRLSARKMYLLLQPVSMGRDKFEQFCYGYGFKLALKRSYHRTTDSLGVTRFENLITSMELTGVNQVWVSDITYYRIGERFYYITFILDLYSRFIVGYAASNSLLTSQTTIPALKMALKLRKPDPGLIFHSDGGGQYYSKAFLAITQGRIRNSMCESVYDNAHAERINGTIKNDYLVYYAPQNYPQLITLTAKAVNMYNSFRPHSSLNNKSPSDYETPTLINKEKRSKKEKSCGNMESSIEFTTFQQLQ
jgi:transposase InsO family protein